MAKSLRSKWRRKCRAVKRVRYGEKELDRLKKTLGIDEPGKGTDVKMAEVNEIATVTDVEAIKKKKADNKPTLEMEIDGKSRVFNLKTMRDQNGSCPLWLHQRKIKKNSRKGKGKKKN